MKYDFLGMVIVLVTKMDRVDLGCELPSHSYQDTERGIRKVFKEDVGIEHVIFAHPETKDSHLSNAICNLVKDMPLRQLEYSDIEITEHFGIKHKCCANNDVSQLKQKGFCTPTKPLDKLLNFEKKTEESTIRATTQQPRYDSYKLSVKGHSFEQLDHISNERHGCPSERAYSNMTIAANATNHEVNNANDNPVHETENMTCRLAFTALIHEALAMILAFIHAAVAMFSEHFRQ